MISNYFKVAFRSLLRSKLTTFINIAGLALAIACALLIYLFIKDELSYDKHHQKAERIFRVTRSFLSDNGEVNLHLAHVAPPIGPLLKNDFGEIETMARTINYGVVIGLEESGELVKSNNEDRVFIVEPDIFKIFDIKVLSGDPAQGLARPFTVMLSEKTARRYFGNENIVGKRLRADNQYDLEITGVFKDFPLQSHWHPEFLISFSTLEDDNIYGRNGLETNWGNNSFGTYLVLAEGVKADDVQSKLSAFIDNHFGNYARAQWGAAPDWVASKTTAIYLQKVTDVHLHSHLDDEQEVNGNINNVYMMAVIGVFIILIACFNFINLSTARATKRAKEVGLRKVVGAFKHQLIYQYLSESILITIISLVAAIALTIGGLTWLNTFTGKALSLNLHANLFLTGALIIFAVAIGLVAGIYPAFVMSSFKPVLTLKGQQGSSAGKGGIRKVLVVTQFAISITLIIATLITFQQLDFLNQQNLGYNKDQVVTLPYYEDVADSYDAFYNELTKNAQIENITRSSRIPTGRLLDSYGGARVVEGDSMTNAQVSLKTISIDDNFFPTYNVKMTAGRNFSRAIPTDDSLAFIINEQAAREMNWSNFEKHINDDFEYAGVKGKLIGIVKDFHFESLHQTIAPMVFLQRKNNYGVLSIKINSKEMQQGLAQVENVWKQFLPSRPFDYEFLSESYRQLYEAEQKQGTLFTVFATLAILIACLGLFGLAVFSTMQRVKEIGIRKVLGASVPDILSLLSKEIIILIVIANGIAWPLAWYFMSKWLNSFAYHIDMNLLTYLTTAIVATIVALITISTQTIKAAMSNPAKTLKYE